MITLEEDRLVFRIPEVHADAALAINFQRTLRIPDDNREYPLPPGLGEFPLTHIDDHAARVPERWLKRGGVLLPMYQAEAMWICFQSPDRYPVAIKVAAGKINAVTGEGWSEGLQPKPQDYMVSPGQPWLDGFCVQKGLIRQFVAMPLGEGYSAEEQLTGEAEHGGLQLLVYPMKAEAYERLRQAIERAVDREVTCLKCVTPTGAAMGLAPGGLMRQQIYEDWYGTEAWDTSVGSRCFVHIVNSAQYIQLTGHKPPTRPPTAKDYTKAGLPWFDYYDAELKALEGAKKLAGLDSVAAKGVKKGEQPLLDNDPVEPANVKTLTKRPNTVRKGRF